MERGDLGGRGKGELFVYRGSIDVTWIGTFVKGEGGEQHFQGGHLIVEDTPAEKGGFAVNSAIEMGKKGISERRTHAAQSKRGRGSVREGGFFLRGGGVGPTDTVLQIVKDPMKIKVGKQCWVSGIEVSSFSVGEPSEDPVAWR